jgi:hypothetical protein
MWVVSGAGSFSTRAEYYFNGTSLPIGLGASNYTVGGRSDAEPGSGSEIQYDHNYNPVNVGVSNGFVNLKVPGGQNPNATADGALSAAEIETDERGILYASVRTRAIFSPEPGTVHGESFPCAVGARRTDHHQGFSSTEMTLKKQTSNMSPTPTRDPTMGLISRFPYDTPIRR